MIFFRAFFIMKLYSLGEELNDKWIDFAMRIQLIAQAMFVGGKISLVHENSGTWALPGGRCDIDQYVMF